MPGDAGRIGRAVLLAAVAAQAAIGLLQHGPVFRELASSPAFGGTALKWVPGTSVLMVAALVVLAFSLSPGRPEETVLSHAGRASGIGLALVAGLGLFHFGIGLFGGRMFQSGTLLYLGLAGAVAAWIRTRRSAGRESSERPETTSERRQQAWSAWDAVTLIFLLSALVATVFPYAFEDARVIWGCRAFAMEAAGSLGGIADCSHAAYPPLFSVLLWTGVRDPLFEGRLLPWLILVFFALFFRGRVGQIAPAVAAPATLFLVSTVHVWQGTATLYANATTMALISAGSLLSLGLPAAASEGPGRGEQMAGAICLAGAVLIRPDGFYYLAVVVVAAVLARVRWGQIRPLAPFLFPVLVFAAWAARPGWLRHGPAGASYSGSFLGNATGEWRSVADSAGAALGKVTLEFLDGWQGQWLSHKGLGVAFYLLVAVTLAAARKGLIGREGESLQPGARMSGLVTLGSGLAVVLCYAAVPYVSDPVGAVQPLAGGYLVCYRNFIRVGLGRMTIHLFPFAVLFVAGLLDGLGRGPGEVTGS